VAAAFGAAAIAYARGRVTLGEALAFAGTLAFGNGIWLIAQVLHIRGHFPDAFFWVAIGALATGFLVRSTWAGVQAAVVFFVWIVTEATFEARPLYVFMPLWPLTVVLAYRLGSPAMLVISALTAALWIAVATSAGDTVLMPAAAVLAGCVLHAVGRLSAGALPIRHAWQAAGLVVLLVTFMPLMTTGAQQAIRNGPGDAAAITIAIGVAVAAVAATLRRPSTAADGGVALVACTVTLWAIATAAGIPAGRWAAGVVGATLFSVLALTMAVTLIRSAFGSDRTADLAFGVLFALGLLILRWLSVLENLLLSGMFLLAAGGGLLVLARLWLTRHQVKAARGGAQ
jgi:uncharacterized membrane protein